MSEKIFVDGVFCKSVNTQFGEIVKLSFDMEAFIAFARANCVKSEKNGKYYLNANCLSTKEGSRYMALDKFEPKPQQAPPQDHRYNQSQQPPPMPDGSCDCEPMDDKPF